MFGHNSAISALSHHSICNICIYYCYSTRIKLAWRFDMKLVYSFHEIKYIKGSSMGHHMYTTLHLSSAFLSRYMFYKPCLCICLCAFDILYISKKYQKMVLACGCFTETIYTHQQILRMFKIRQYMSTVCLKKKFTSVFVEPWVDITHYSPVVKSDQKKLQFICAKCTQTKCWGFQT